MAVAHAPQRSGARGDVHEPAVRAHPQQIGEGDRQPPRPERVRLQRLAHDVEVGAQHAHAGIPVDRRVVHQHVERVELRPDGGDRRLVVDVEPDGSNVTRERRHRGGVPGAGDHRVAALGELARHFEPDPAVRARDQRNGHGVSLPHRACFPAVELRLIGAGGEPVDFARTIASHGVAELPPNRLDLPARVLETTLPVPGGARTISISERDRTAIVELRAGRSGTRIAEALTRTVRHMLRLDEDLSAFYEICRDDPQLSWCVNGAGRMLRAPTVFEDVVKTICTTNTAWAGTRRMTAALVEHLGQEAPGGGRAFPTPEAMAGAGEDFYRDVARAGYRGAYLRQLATDVVEGRTDLEALADPELPDTEVAERLLALPGVGPYAAAHVMLTSLGHHRRLVLDAWSRPTYAKLSGARRALKDATIERRFKRYGRWAGLAFWLYVTRDWVEDGIAQEAS
jgi:N-glycosylase/DNA lyase